jgi:hypothetical protein
MMVADGRANIAGRTGAAVTALALSAGLLTGCAAGTSRSCNEQAALANAFAHDELFNQISVSQQSIEAYVTYPCKENSGGSLVTAGKRYELDKPLTFEKLRTVSAGSAEATRWRPIAQLRPTDPGAGNDAHICFQSTTGKEPQYLTFHATQSEPFFLYVEVSQAEREVEMCPAAE